MAVIFDFLPLLTQVVLNLLELLEHEKQQKYAKKLIINITLFAYCLYLAQIRILIISVKSLKIAQTSMFVKSIENSRQGYSSVGSGPQQSLLAYSELTSSELTGQHDEDGPLTTNFNDCIAECQRLRTENCTLKKQVQILRRKLESQRSQASTIGQFSYSSKSSIAATSSCPDEEIIAYKKQLYEQYKRKIKQMRAATDYVVRCYLQYARTGAGTKLKKMLEGLREDRSIVKIVELWREGSEQNNDQEVGNLETNLHKLEKQETQQLREQIQKLKKLVDYLVKDTREELEKMKKQIQTAGEKVCGEMKKCIEKYMGHQNGKQNQRRIGSGKHKVSKPKATQQVKQKKQDSGIITPLEYPTTDQSLLQTGHSIKKIKNTPPLPINYQASHTLIYVPKGKKDNSIYGATPKNCSSTPKNNRSFSNVLYQQPSASKVGMPTKKCK